MQIKYAIGALTLGACLCAALPVHAEASGKPERTFYSDAEKKHAHAREVSVITAEPYQTELSRERVRRFYLVPELGMEVATIGAYIYTAPNTTTVVQSQSTVGAAPAFGVQGGWRLGHFNLGARYQGAVFMDATGRNPSLNLNKVYGEIGFNSRRGPLILSGFLAGGWAFAVTQNSFTNGVGGKAGLAFDFLVSRAFTLGPGLSFDVHAYNPAASNQWNLAYGGSAFLRLGFQI